MSEVVHKPATEHHCNVGWEPRPLPEGSDLRRMGWTTYMASVGQNDPPGTIRRCECGKTWVGYRQRYVEGMRGMHIVSTQWRREGWFARWRRERRERRAG